MIVPVEVTDYDRKLILPFTIQSMGILFDVISTYIASLYGIPEGNPNVNLFLEFIIVTIAMMVGISIYKKIKNELYYKALIIISFITFIPAIYNFCILSFLTSFPF
jgi:hypothetical protein